MTAGENRADGNLVLLCIEHSYEVDEHHDRFPAELLREWKQAQLDEYERARDGWRISDTEAGRVLQASDQEIERHHSVAVLGIVRSVERLSLAARQKRKAPAAAAAEWRIARTHAARSSVIWDADGNRIYAEPSRRDRNHHIHQIQTALAETVECIRPLVDDAKVEVAAARASRPDLKPWSDWVTRALYEVVSASSKWPGPPDFEEDDLLERALQELADATDALVRLWRGERSVPSPPNHEIGGPPEESSRDLLAEHRALLERARPYVRVDHLPFDPQLRSDLAEAAGEAAGIPPVPSALAIGLSATAGLAAAVAANAMESELARLAEEDSGRRPLSTAVHLVAELERIAVKRGREAPRDVARGALIALWDSVDWSDPGVYSEEDRNLYSTLWLASKVTSVEQVKEKLTDALESYPEVVLSFVAATAPWIELVDSETWQTTGFKRRFSELPPWFPVDAVLTSADVVEPHPRAVPIDALGETDSDDPESLLAQVRWLAARSGQAATTNDESLST
ncbi:MAG TPA: hypothetical protein PK132_12655 [Dermatophilaceae bacterium]|jgi:hypothetical protein|nr:hypothetical protein [Dermatophilaceae bacterium]HOR16579.1 hypothetical protein [Dermatophilaceae bacterium]HPK90391.1 hypothetical protein [Dermatophilaceae bacterium]